MLKHVLSAGQYSRKDLEEIFDLAFEIKKDPKKYSKAIDGKIVATMFYEPSTRTRLSFETAVLKLGGQVISTENASANSSVKKGETLKDTVRILQNYADAIVIRHSDDNAADIAVSVAKVPILNAGSGKKEHPTQALLDMYTIREKRGKIDGAKVAILGDLVYGRTIHSLIKLLSLYDNIKIYGLSKKEFMLPQEYVDFLKEKNIEYTVCNSFDEIPKDVDVLYHTRIQQERFEGDFGKEEYIINKETMSKFSDNTIILHPLPRTDEIAEDIDEDPRAVYFEQAGNGLYIRMALLFQAIGN